MWPISWRDLIWPANDPSGGSAPKTFVFYRAKEPIEPVSDPSDGAVASEVTPIIACESFVNVHEEKPNFD
jgi:hypothetical protein